MGCCQPRKVAAAKPLRKEDIQPSAPTIHFVQVNNMALPQSPPLRDVVTSRETSRLVQRPAQFDVMSSITITPGMHVTCRLPSHQQPVRAEKHPQKQGAVQVLTTVRVTDLKRVPSQEARQILGYAAQHVPETDRRVAQKAEVNTHEAGEAKMLPVNDSLPERFSVAPNQEDEARRKDIKVVKRFSLDDRKITFSKAEPRISSIEDLVATHRHRGSVQQLPVGIQDDEVIRKQQGIQGYLSFDELSEEDSSNKDHPSPGKHKPTLSTINEFQESLNRLSPQPSDVEWRDRRTLQTAKINVLKEGGTPISQAFPGEPAAKDSGNSTAMQADLSSSRLVSGEGASGSQTSYRLQQARDSLRIGRQESERLLGLGKIAECDSEFEVSVCPDQTQKGSRLLGGIPSREAEGRSRKSQTLDVSLANIPRRSFGGVRAELPPVKEG